MGTRFCGGGAALLLMCGVVSSAVLGGCRRAVPSGRGVPSSQPASTVTTTRPLSMAAEAAMPKPGVLLAASTRSEQTFESTKAGLRLRYSSDWRAKESPDDLLMLVPINGPEDRTITMDVPDVPKHLPGAMALPLIQSGYIDDLRKHHAGLKVQQSQSVAMTACKARLVQSTWTQNGADYTDVALLIVHADRVYILSLDSDLAGYPAVREEMDRIEKTLEWIK